MKTLAQQKDAEACGRLGNDQGPEGVAQAQLHHQTRYSGIIPLEGKSGMVAHHQGSAPGPGAGEAHPRASG